MRSAVHPVFSLLFQVLHRRFDVEFIAEVAAKGIRRVYTAVLPTRTAESDVQVAKVPFQVILDGDVHDIKNAVEEFRHPRLLFEEILYLLVPAGEFLICIQPAGIQNSPAVEDVSPSVS